MRTVPEAQSAQFLLYSSPPRIDAADAVPPTAAKKCDAHACPWWPYSTSKDFRTNAGLIVVILFFAVISALALNAAVRHFLLSRRRRNNQRTEAPAVEITQPKSALCSGEARAAEPPAVVFAAGMKLAGAEAECAICLSEFIEGEGIRVMEKCKHGFHVQCIEKWLNSRSSCPTCRGSCYPPAFSASGEVTGCTGGNGAHRDLESGGRESAGDPRSPLV